MKRILTLFLVLAIGTTLNAQKETKKEQIARLYTEVDIFLSEGDADNARLPLEKLVKLDKPNRSNLYLALGSIAEQKKETGRAINFYKKSISADKKSHKASYSMGALYYNKAIDMFNYLSNNLLTEQTQQQKAIAEQVLADFKKALPFLEKGFQLSGDKDIYKEPLNTVYLYLKLDKVID